MRLLILQGGDSPERVVSLRSGDAVSAAARQAGLDVATYDPIDGDNGLAEAVKSSDIVLPILHGIEGEDGTIQKKLDDLGVPYLGSTEEVSALCFDKVKSHNILEKAGINMPAFAVVTQEDLDHELFQKPYVLKPIKGGSSVDTLIVRTPNANAQNDARELLSKYDEMILEELIEGQELTVAILGDKPLPVIAIVPPADGEFDFENKYNGMTQELCPAPLELVSEQKQQEAQEIALNVHRELGARDISRTDIMMNSEGELFVLELNTIPGMTPQSLFPKAAAVAGYEMPDLVRAFVDLIQGR